MRTCDLIIVLGCSLSYPEVLRRRVSHGVELLENGAAKQILLSGGPNNEDKVPESHVMKEMCIEMGVEEGSIILEDRSLDTIENARYSEPLMKKAGAKTAYLVTSTYHSYRSGIIFRTLLPGIEFLLSPCEDRFSEEEFERRTLSEIRYLKELATKGFVIPAR